MKGAYSRSILITAAWFSIALANALPPNQFVVQAIEGDNSEIILGNYAISHGASASIKRFARVLMADQIKAKNQMVTVAKAMHIAPPAQPTSQASSEQDKLTGLKGGAFDREFAAYMVKDHEDDIRNFEAEARADKGKVSALASKQLSVLRKDLRMARALL